MKKSKIDSPILKGDEIVTCTSMGDIFEIKYLSCRNFKQTVKKLDKDHVLSLSTGEVIEINHSDNRSENLVSVARSFRRLRELINANYSKNCPDHLLWLTLTFKENERDPKVFSHCFDIFWKRMKRYFERNSIEIPKYITCVEPQSRGAWHGHMLLFFQSQAPFISNNEVLEKYWEWGFTKVQRLDGVTNVGAYLTAYLTDIPLDEIEDISVSTKYGSEVDMIQGQSTPKKFVKGGRLHLYPSGMKLFRASHGLNKPVKSIKTLDQAFDIISCLNGKLCYEHTILLEDPEKDFSSIVCTKQFLI